MKCTANELSSELSWELLHLAQNRIKFPALKKNCLWSLKSDIAYCDVISKTKWGKSSQLILQNFQNIKKYCSKPLNRHLYQRKFSAQPGFHAKKDSRDINKAKRISNYKDFWTLFLNAAFFVLLWLRINANPKIQKKKIQNKKMRIQNKNGTPK